MPTYRPMRTQNVSSACAEFIGYLFWALSGSEQLIERVSASLMIAFYGKLSKIKRCYRSRRRGDHRPLSPTTAHHHHDHRQQEPVDYCVYLDQSATTVYTRHQMPLKQISQRATLIDSMPLTEPHALSVSGSLPLSVSVALCLSLSLSLSVSLYLSLSVSLCTSLSVSVAEKRLGSTVLEYCMEIVFKI